ELADLVVDVVLDLGHEPHRGGLVVEELRIEVHQPAEQVHPERLDEDRLLLAGLGAEVLDQPRHLLEVVRAQRAVDPARGQLRGRDDALAQVGPEAFLDHVDELGEHEALHRLSHLATRGADYTRRGAIGQEAAANAHHARDLPTPRPARTRSRSADSRSCPGASCARIEGAVAPMSRAAPKGSEMWSGKHGTRYHRRGAPPAAAVPDAARTRGRHGKRGDGISTVERTIHLQGARGG